MSNLSEITEPTSVPLPDLLTELGEERVVDLHWGDPSDEVTAHTSAYVMETLDPNWQAGPRQAFRLIHANLALNSDRLKRWGNLTNPSRLGAYVSAFLPRGVTGNEKVIFRVQGENGVIMDFEFWSRETFLGIRNVSHLSSGLDSKELILAGTAQTEELDGLRVDFSPEELTLSASSGVLRVLLPHRQMPVLDAANVPFICRREGYRTRVPRWVGMCVSPDLHGVYVLSDDGQLVSVVAQDRPY